MGFDVAHGLSGSDALSDDVAVVCGMARRALKLSGKVSKAVTTPGG